MIADTVVGSLGWDVADSSFEFGDNNCWIGFASGSKISTSKFFLRKKGKHEVKSSKNNENLSAL